MESGACAGTTSSADANRLSGVSRVGDMGLNDTPWTAVATTNPNPNARDNTFEVVIDLDKTGIEYMMWFTKTQRFGVTTVAALGVQSELAQASDENPKQPQ